MRLLILGATGRTGRLIVERALATGHEVVAYVRNPAKMTVTHDRLSVVTGELADAAAITAAMRGVDAVIASLTPPISGRPTGPSIAEGTRTVLNAMSAEGVGRLVFNWGPSITLPECKWNWLFGAMYALSKVLPALRPLIEDSIEIRKAISSSEIDWTIVIVVRPVDKPATGNVKVTVAAPDAKAGMASTSRHDLAQFLLDEAVAPRHSRQTVLVNN